MKPTRCLESAHGWTTRAIGSPTKRSAFCSSVSREFDGVVILASNFRSNIDDAFLRRFHSIVQFVVPKPPERLRLWRGAFSKASTLEEGIDLERLAEKFDMTGGAIMNVVRYASLLALSRESKVIRKDDIEEGIRREMLKEGRIV
jgi:ATP-dependent 26S proteasome regulatory subunit